jgi:TRAP-type mannitol/chloroaromatic compound transport system permease small subunit
MKVSGNIFELRVLIAQPYTISRSENLGIVKNYTTLKTKYTTNVLLTEILFLNQ